MTADQPTLNLVSGSDLQAELRLRRTTHIFRTVRKSAVPEDLAAGWEVVRENVTSVRMQKPKPFDQQLEDDVWTLLARLGFTQMNAGRHLTLPIAKGPNGAPVGKQIDVLAADDETVLVVECKASAKVTSRPMGAYLAEVSGLKGRVAAALRSEYGVKKKVGWLVVTRNIVWGQNDRARADEFRIRILTDNDLDYFIKFTDLVGPAARHQLQAEIFGDQEIEGLARTVPAVRGRIAGKRFYQFTLDPERLLKTAFISHRVRLDAESVGTYQRMLKRSRLKSIREFIDEGGVFPTNIVINFRSKRRFDLSAEKVEGDVAFGTLYLPKTYKSAWVIDGQHRLYGFAGNDRARTNQLPVLAFEGLQPSEEAKMFVDINNKQVKVPRNLLVDLMSELYWDSPDAEERYHALVSRVIAVLGRDIASPIRNRLVQEGDKQAAASPLTITAIYEAIKKSDLVGLVRKGVFHPGPFYEKDSLTAMRRSVDMFGGYLTIFSSALPDHWALGNAEGGYLCTNNGVSALLLVLRAVIDHLGNYADLKPYQAAPDELMTSIRPLVEPVVKLFEHADATTIRAYRRQVGNAGQRQAAFAMMELIKTAKPSFSAPGLDEYIRSLDQTGTNKARVLMPELQLMIQRIALRLLRSEFGDDEAGWWRKGVPTSVRTEVAARREASAEPGAYEEFFELLDYRAIGREHWELFEPFYGFGSGKGKDRRLEWFSKLFTIRNRIAHPERGTVSDAELAMIESLVQHFEAASKSLPL